MIGALALLAVTISVEPAFVDCRPTHSVHPYRVVARNAGPDTEGVLRIEDGSRGGGLELSLELARGAHKRLVVPVPPFRGPTAEWRSPVDRASVEVGAVAPCDGTVVARLLQAGRTGGRWPGESDGLRFEHGQLEPQDLDGDWIVLEALDTVIAEARDLSELSDGRFEKLRGWVSRGGLLIVVPGVDPASLERQGRLAAGLDLRDERLQSASMGAGTVVVSPTFGAGNETADRAVRAAADRQRVERARRRGIPAAAAPGRGFSGVVSNVPSDRLTFLGLAFLSAAVAEFLFRRRWMRGRGDPRRYLGALAGLVAALSIGAIAVARSGLRSAVGAPVLVASSGAETALRYGRTLLMPGDRRNLPGDAWPLSAPFPESLSMRLGESVGLRNEGKGALLVSVAPLELGGAVELARRSGGWTVRNGTGIRLERGVLVEARRVYIVPSLSPGDHLQALPSSAGAVQASPLADRLALAKRLNEIAPVVFVSKELDGPIAILEESVGIEEAP